MGREAVYDRRSQASITIRVDKSLRNQFKDICLAEGISVQLCIENMIKQRLVEHHTKDEQK
ncbi:hypothetical protein COA01_23305 [Bacillus cereus]|uniref:hypothetical protein n=1 Tax=Bacillus cereus TaxID=1396 RepID=UPI000BFDE356|nr:hypothetical protein [Bacillus cereus]PGP18673.1 hypothetical protein COA01_23305 [Bacillus cereus]